MLLFGPPVGPLQEGPPLSPIAQIDPAGPRYEHQRTGIKHVRQRARIIIGIGRNLRERDVPGRLHEILELPVGDRGAVNQERIHCDSMDRRLLGIMLIRSHAISATRNQNHPER